MSHSKQHLNLVSFSASIFLPELLLSSVLKSTGRQYVRQRSSFFSEPNECFIVQPAVNLFSTMSARPELITELIDMRKNVVETLNDEGGDVV